MYALVQFTLFWLLSAAAHLLSYCRSLDPEHDQLGYDRGRISDWILLY